MALTVRAWRLRLEAADAVRRGDYTVAAEVAVAAERIVRTPRGAALRALAKCLAASHSSSPAAPLHTHDRGTADDASAIGGLRSE